MTHGGTTIQKTFDSYVDYSAYGNLIFNMFDKKLQWPDTNIYDFSSSLSLSDNIKCDINENTKTLIEMDVRNGVGNATINEGNLIKWYTEKWGHVQQNEKGDMIINGSSVGEDYILNSFCFNNIDFENGKAVTEYSSGFPIKDYIIQANHTNAPYGGLKILSPEELERVAPEHLYDIELNTEHAMDVSYNFTDSMLNSLHALGPEIGMIAAVGTSLGINSASCMYGPKLIQKAQEKLSSTKDKIKNYIKRLY